MIKMRRQMIMKKQVKIKKKVKKTTQMTKKNLVHFLKNTLVFL